MARSARSKLVIGGYTYDLSGRKKYVGPVNLSSRWRLDIDDCLMAMNEADARRFLDAPGGADLEVYRIDSTGQYGRKPAVAV